MNSFGKKLVMSTFGESHGKALGCILDGVPAGVSIDTESIQSELNRRKPGKSALETRRKESDTIEILSGVFEGVSTGTPIAMVIYNEDQKSKDYESIKNIFRPGHADFTYWHKYGIRDYRGGGRSSARETAARVAAGAVAKQILSHIGIEIFGGVLAIDGIECEDIDFEYAKRNLLYTLDETKYEAQIQAVTNAKKSHDSVGGVVLTVAKGVPVGLGQPLYYKLDAVLAEAMMGINAAKGVEIGGGFSSAHAKGSYNNDPITSHGFSSNHAGGMLGGISNGDEVIVKTYFKPTPSISQPQQTTTLENTDTTCTIKGRHDPCVAIRGSVVCEAMMALVLADMALLHLGSQVLHLEKIYTKTI